MLFSLLISRRNIAVLFIASAVLFACRSPRADRDASSVESEPKENAHNIHYENDTMLALPAENGRSPSDSVAEVGQYGTSAEVSVPNVAAAVDSGVSGLPDSLSALPNARKTVVEVDTDTVEFVEASTEEYVEEDLGFPLDSGELFRSNNGWGDSPEEDPVLTERLLKSEVVTVRHPEPATVRDSVLGEVERKMSLRSEPSLQRVVVERWQSPVNFRGYKFNRKKLMLYGVDPNTNIALFFYLEGYYLSANSDVYYLWETTSVTRDLETVRDTALAHYLVSRADGL